MHVEVNDSVIIVLYLYFVPRVEALIEIHLYSAEMERG